MFGASTNNAINNDVHLHSPAPYQWLKWCKICALFWPRVIFVSYSAWPLSHVDSIYCQITQRVKFMKMYARLMNICAPIWTWLISPMSYILKNSTVPEPDPSQLWDLENTTQEVVSQHKNAWDSHCWIGWYLLITLGLTSSVLPLDAVW